MPEQRAWGGVGGVGSVGWCRWDGVGGEAMHVSPTEEVGWVGGGGIACLLKSSLKEEAEEGARDTDDE